MNEEGVASKRAKALPKPKKTKAATGDDKENEKKKSRSTFFTEEETDLLLSLLMASELLSQATNKITPNGRIKSWQDLHRIFNSSPGVHVSFCVFVSLFSLVYFFSVFFLFSNAKKKCCALECTIFGLDWAN